MNLPPDSLSGKNASVRAVGTRSSRVRATFLNQISKCDREVQKLDDLLKFYTCNGFFWNVTCSKFKKRRDKWDLKRKEIRLKRKGYSL